MSLEFPSHDNLIRSLTTPDAVRLFLQSEFPDGQGQPYTSNVFAYLERYFPHRLKSPSYLMFYSRVVLMAAEFGFRYASGHMMRDELFRRDQINDLEDFMDPRTILALGGYLADINLRSAPNKKLILNDLKQRGRLSPALERKVWATWVRPGNELPTTEDFLFGTCRLPFDNRIGLKIFVPETPFHQKVQDIGFTCHDVNTLPQERFEQEKLPRIAEAFSFIPDIETVFINPNENWNTTSLKPN